MAGTCEVSSEVETSGRDGAVPADLNPGSVDAVADMDDVVARILNSYDTITVVGASAHPAKPAHGVPALMQRHGWRIVPVNLRGGQILGEQAYRTPG